jgi:hypothetical protein
MIAIRKKVLKILDFSGAHYIRTSYANSQKNCNVFIDAQHCNSDNYYACFVNHTYGFHHIKYSFQLTE